MSLIYIDVNDLKEINEKYGRQASDEVLSHVVTCARKHIRPGDLLFRFGTGEFVIVQFETDKALAGAIAARIRQAVESEGGSPELQARARVGIAVSAMPDDGHSVESLVAAARQRTGASEPQRFDEPPQHPRSIH
jgi:diguanylate cyclase (GGDEF)-like protein